MVRYWLDCDTTPALKSRYSGNSLEAVQKRACRMLNNEVTEGQIGIYASAHGGEFYGFAIKYRGETAYFEEPSQ